jgi:hypothetical protein
VRVSVSFSDRGVEALTFNETPNLNAIQLDKGRVRFALGLSADRKCEYEQLAATADTSVPRFGNRKEKKTCITASSLSDPPDATARPKSN